MTLHPFEGMDVWSLVEHRAATTGDAPFLTWQPFDGAARTWTYRELAHDAARLGVGLANRGVQAGDRVLLHLDNRPELLLAWFGCAALGAVAVTTNTRAAVDEVAYFAEHARATAAVTEQRHLATVAAAGRGLSWIASVDDGGFTALLGDPTELRRRPPDPSAPMCVQYTSGTTSRPKGVVWTHANALWGARVNAVHEGLHASDCHLVYMPLFHTNALTYSMLPSMWAGGRVVLVPKWSTTRFWDISLRHGCTWLSLIWASQQVLATTEPPAGHSYRMFGGPLVGPPLHPGLAAVPTIGWWGMTETVAQAIVSDPFLPSRSMTMGRPAPEYGIAVVRDDGAAVEPDETGHLLVKGRPGLSLFAEYLDDPAATAAAFDERGWFHTGDLVTPGADGCIAFSDRSKDMLRVGDENVAASEVERVALTVAGAAEAAVVGRPDDRLQEVPVAFVMARGAGAGVAAEVMAACRRMLADFKVPREVHVVRELPRSTLRKVDKAALRAVAAPNAEHERAAAEARWLTDAASDPSADADIGA